MFKIYIDGKELQAEPGQTILQVALKAGIEIPHFCWHPALSISGNCRMCLVEIEKMPKLQTACSTPVSDGMVVYTNSEKVIKARRGVLEFLLTEHPLDCPICDQAGECRLQDYYMLYGKYESRFAEKKLKKRKVVDLGANIILDTERCILCTRCIRFFREITKTDELGIFNRGDHSEIDTYPGKKLESIYSGNIVDICPVGALTNKDFRFKCRVWFLDKTPSICPLCSRGCNIEIHHRAGKVYRIKPRTNLYVNQYWICDEGRYGYKFINAEDRVLKPMIKGSSGYVSVEWEVAAIDVFVNINSIVAKYGPDSVGIVASPHLTNEDGYCLMKFAKEVIKTDNIGFLPSIKGDHDEFLIRPEKAPNEKGLLDMGWRSWDDGGKILFEKIEKGRIKALYVTGGEYFLSIVSESANLLRKLEYSVFHMSNKKDGLDTINVILPSATYAEKDGTFTNFQGRIQRINRAFDPIGESLPDWRIIKRLATIFGKEFPYEKAEDIFKEISNRVAAYKGIDYMTIGDEGVLSHVS
uniref:NADH dehydrogenase I subunit G n=1 Tax=uncultured prokaryote TaxID=198431 RepID=H5SP83_9ZZZZ|nr:NADH dehydrogenase I subunit G [uncultured prokaryote]